MERSFGTVSWGPRKVKALLYHDKIDVDARDNEGRTPSSWAAEKGAVQLTNLPLEHGRGVDVNARDNRCHGLRLGVAGPGHQ